MSADGESRGGLFPFWGRRDKKGRNIWEMAAEEPPVSGDIKRRRGPFR